MRRCLKCDAAIPITRRSGAKFCSDRHKSEWHNEQDRTDKRLDRDQRPEKRRRRGPGARLPTRYAILEESGLSFRVIGFEEANKANYALRRFGRGDRAISARLLEL